MHGLPNYTTMHGLPNLKTPYKFCSYNRHLGKVEISFMPQCCVQMVNFLPLNFTYVYITNVNGGGLLSWMSVGLYVKCPLVLLDLNINRHMLTYLVKHQIWNYTKIRWVRATLFHTDPQGTKTLLEQRQLLTTVQRKCLRSECWKN